MLIHSSFVNQVLIPNKFCDFKKEQIYQVEKLVFIKQHNFTYIFYFNTIFLIPGFTILGPFGPFPSLDKAAFT